MEQGVLAYLWSHGPSTAEACRQGLLERLPMKDSTIRTVLRRLERKGHVRHSAAGRAFVYRATEPQRGFAASIVRQLIDRFFSGSAEELVIGMVEQRVLTSAQLRRLVRQIEQGKRRG